MITATNTTLATPASNTFTQQVPHAQHTEHVMRYASDVREKKIEEDRKEYDRQNELMSLDVTYYASLTQVGREEMGTDTSKGLAAKKGRKRLFNSWYRKPSATTSAPTSYYTPCAR